MKFISRCSTDGCGLIVGYERGDGSEICWLHAEQALLPAHAHWLREYQTFAKTFAVEFRRTATKRDNYGVLGMP